jgi:hypothetical protein
LNNSRVGHPLNVPRDIGFTMLDSSLNTRTSEYYEGEIDDDATGKFYDVDGNEIALSNTDNAWITDY